MLCLVDLCRAVPLILILYLPTSISGTLPPDVFSNFGTIIHLELDRTALSGTLPPQFSEMTKLRYLELYSTVISGTVPPTAFSNMPQARAVHVALTSTRHSRPRGALTRGALTHRPRGTHTPSTWHSRGTHVHVALTSTWHSRPHGALTRRPRGTHTPSTWHSHTVHVADLRPGDRELRAEWHAARFSVRTRCARRPNNRTSTAAQLPPRVTSATCHIRHVSRRRSEAVRVRPHPPLRHALHPNRYNNIRATLLTRLGPRLRHRSRSP